MQKYTRLDIEQVTEFYLASEVDARIAELERPLSHAPIASLRVVDGTITRAAFYAPGLPDGHHDVWSAPVSERERIAELEKALIALMRSHHGYAMGLGPCICVAHEDARKLLGMTRDDA